MTGKKSADVRVHAYQQFVMHLIDEMGNDVLDYRVDFHVIDDSIKTNSLHHENLDKLRQYQDLTERLQEDVIVDVEPHTVNNSYRTFFINIDALRILEKDIANRVAAAGRPLYIAMNIDAIGPTADLTYNTDDLQYITVVGIFPTTDRREGPVSSRPIPRPWSRLRLAGWLASRYEHPAN